ncbi:hypothetical protein TTY48_20190 [Tsukamurella sp. TY48]|nr:hypothetical protein TTY48_20190 [Tsukamurella sp. TY48]
MSPRVTAAALDDAAGAAVMVGLLSVEDEPQPASSIPPNVAIATAVTGVADLRKVLMWPTIPANP